MRLEPLTLQTQPIFERYARRGCPGLSHYSFAPLYIWREHFAFYWTLIAEHLCIFAKQAEDYFMPILPMPCTPEARVYGDVIEQAYRFMLETNRNPHIARIENVPAEMLDFFEARGFCASLKESEYLYETALLAGLRGIPFKGQRHAYNVFRRQHPLVELLPYRAADREPCFALYDRWHAERAVRYEDDIYRAMLEDSRSAHRLGIANAEALGLVGRVVRIDGDVRGYTFGYPLNRWTFCVLFEIADLSVKGLPQFMYREFCKELMETYRWVNAMSDSGLENLKRVKESYRQTELLRSYSVVSR